MSIRFLTLAGLILAGVSAYAGPAFTGPTSSYFVSNSSTMWQIQGLTVLNSWSVGGLPAAIDTTIRMNGNSPDTDGNQYTLAGTPTGTTYTNTTRAMIWDGTTDTVHNYTVSSGAGSDVIQTNVDWTSPVVLFNLGGSGYDSLGITYDGTNNSLWVSQWNAGDLVSNYSLSGTLLSSFHTGFADIGALALDPVDDTLWMTTYGSNVLYQFDKAGNFLQSGTVSGVTGNLWSGEMVETASLVSTGAPEPGTLLMGVGGALALLIRSRVRSPRRSVQ